MPMFIYYMFMLIFSCLYYCLLFIVYAKYWYQHRTIPQVYITLQTISWMNLKISVFWLLSVYFFILFSFLVFFIFYFKTFIFYFVIRVPPNNFKILNILYFHFECFFYLLFCLFFFLFFFSLFCGYSYFVVDWIIFCPCWKILFSYLRKNPLFIVYCLYQILIST